jgi:hypothetical protein
MAGTSRPYALGDDGSVNNGTITRSAKRAAAI